MNVAKRFWLRMIGIVLIACAGGVFIVKDSWGTGAIACLSGAAAVACVMGAIGFRSLQQAMGCDSSRLMSVVMIGMMGRALVLLLSMVLVFQLAGDEWGRRTLIATSLLYLLVLGTEIVTLNQALSAGVWQKSAKENQESAESESTKESSDS